MRYKYKSISPNGQKNDGIFIGSSEADVINMLKGNNELIISIERDIEAEAQIVIFKQKVKKKDLAIFCRQFYTMIDAGLGIIKCLEILVAQTQNKILKNTISDICEDVQKGSTLSEAMGKHKNIFPTILISMIEAGEVSGNLDTIMERMAIHFEKENRLESKIKGSMIYPMALIVVSIAVVIFMLIAVLPTFIGMFEGSETALPWPTQFLISLSDSIKSFWYIYVGVISAISIGIIAFKKSPEGQRFFDNLKITIPGLKITTSKIITSRFTRTLSTLMSSGIPLLQAMEVVGKVVNNTVIQDRLEVSIENIRKGVTLSRAVKDVGVFPPMVDSMIRIGEESGSLDDMLYKTADFYDEEVEASLQKLTTLIEPILIVGMALVIGFIVIAMAMPMFDMVNTI
jgi:type IV pilus assembly protein PilC